MQFEVNSEKPTSGTIELESSERALINEALFTKLLKAATEGPQFTKGEVLEILCRMLLNPSKISVTTIVVSSHHLEALASVVADNSKGIAFEQAQEVGGFISQLNVAANVLSQNATMEASIDEIVEGIVIPDSPEGLEG